MGLLFSRGIRIINRNRSLSLTYSTDTTDSSEIPATSGKSPSVPVEPCVCISETSRFCSLPTTDLQATIPLLYFIASLIPALMYIICRLLSKYIYLEKSKCMLT